MTMKCEEGDIFYDEVNGCLKFCMITCQGCAVYFHLETLDASSRSNLKLQDLVLFSLNCSKTSTSMIKKKVNA